MQVNFESSDARNEATERKPADGMIVADEIVALSPRMKEVIDGLASGRLQITSFTYHIPGPPLPVDGLYYAPGK